MRRFENFKIGNDLESVDSLERYFSVMNDDSPAKFRICKRIEVDLDLDSEKARLLEEHESAMGRFGEVFDELEGGEIDLSELEKPEISLLDLKIEISERILQSCHFCERECGASRYEGETGVCGVGEKAKVASEFIHVGEESELVPSYTVFFSGCTFNCQFCQNWDISQNPDSGVVYTPQEIAESISEMRGKREARNVNWVGGDPTPNLHNVLKSLNQCEVNIPSVWNSNMYLTRRGMKLLEGTQDVYLTDFKYGNNECGLKYSKVPDYWDIVSRNHKLAFEDAELIIRHLVLPEHLECCTKEILKWIRSELGSEIRINLLGQYRPEGRAREYSEISRRVSSEEMEKAYEFARKEGLNNIVR